MSTASASPRPWEGEMRERKAYEGLLLIRLLEPSMSPSRLLATTRNALLLVAVPGALLAGCQPDQRTTIARERGAVERAQVFRSLVRHGRYEEAREMMAADPRRWFAPREGPGEPWRVEPGAGPWSAWDEQFRSEGEVVRWREGPTSATAVVQGDQ